MTLAPIYLLALGWGLAGGFSHCIGMCGVFVISYAGLPDKGSGKHWKRHALFHGGRLLSLTALGAVGGAVGQLTHAWAQAQGLLSLAAGVVMLGLSLGVSGLVPRLALPEPDVLGAGGGRGRRLFRSVLQSRNALRPLGIGLLVGLLPCGLTYNTLVPALALGPLRGALLLLTFGLGTVPGLLALGLAGQMGGGLLTRLSFRRAMTRVSAVVMATLGAAFVWRGWHSL